MNVDTLMKAMPGLGRSTATAYLPHMEKAMNEFGITNVHRAWMWLAQTGHESVSLTYLEEIASGAAYEGRKDLGNTQPGDGKKYKGRGPIQITGRSNYTSAGAALKLPLVDQPHIAADPQHAFRVSAWWWKNHGLNEISDRDDVVAATKRINGGTNGLSDRQSRWGKAKALGNAVIPGNAPPPPPPKPPPGGGTAPPLHVDYFGTAHNRTHADVKTWQQQMKARGWKIDADGDYGPKSEQACRSFQLEKGLGSDGKVGPKTWAAAWTAGVT
jgi:predicted chitinase